MIRLLSMSLVATLMLSAAAFGQFQSGQKAPDFTLPDLDGNYVTLSKVIGDGPVYINFWATWCGPCKKEIPDLINLYNKYKDRGFKVLAISTDGSRTVGKVRSFVEDRQMNFTILLDSNGEVFARKYAGRGIPYGFLLDNDGNIVHFVTGYMPGIEKTLTEKMAPYLKPVTTDKKDDSKAKEELKEEPKEEQTEKSSK